MFDDIKVLKILAKVFTTNEEIWQAIYDASVKASPAILSDQEEAVLDEWFNRVARQRNALI